MQAKIMTLLICLCLASAPAMAEDEDDFLKSEGFAAVNAIGLKYDLNEAQAALLICFAGAGYIQGAAIGAELNEEIAIAMITMDKYVYQVVGFAAIQCLESLEDEPEKKES